MREILIFLLFTTVITFETEFIRLDEEESIAILTINRPKALNALNSQVLDELEKTLDIIDTSKIHTLIITGPGDNLLLLEQILQK